MEEQLHLYRNGPYRLRRLGRPTRSGDAAEETPGDAVAAELADNLDAAYEDVKDMEPHEIKKKVELFKTAATIIERRFNVKVRRRKDHDKQRKGRGATRQKETGARPRGRRHDEPKAGERGSTSEGS